MIYISLHYMTDHTKTRTKRLEVLQKIESDIGQNKRDQFQAINTGQNMAGNDASSASP